MVYRELSVLLGAGLTLVRALDVLIDSPETGEPGLLLAGVRDRVREGAGLAAARSDASPSVSAFERAIVEAAEQSATVDVMLERLAEFLEEQEKLRERVQSALIYPSIVFTLGVCVAIVMLGLLLPRARDILVGGDAQLPALTAFMIALGRGVMRVGLPLAALAVVMGFALRRRIAVDTSAREWWGQQTFRLPVLGRGYRLLVNMRFARTLSILLDGGVPLIQAVALAGRATGNAWVARLAGEAAEAVRHGSSLSEAVRRVPPLAESLPAWIQTGEASGGLAKLLENAGVRYQHHWDRYVTRCLGVLEPVLILLIGGFVLLVTLSVLLPVMSLTQAVAR